MGLRLHGSGSDGGREAPSNLLPGSATPATTMGRKTTADLISASPRAIESSGLGPGTPCVPQTAKARPRVASPGAIEGPPPCRQSTAHGPCENRGASPAPRGRPPRRENRTASAGACDAGASARDRERAQRPPPARRPVAAPRETSSL